MIKIGRNELCLCGSGKKYKRCCLSKEATALPKNNRNHPLPQTTKETLVQTLTHELFQPMRLYYTLHDAEKLNFRFKQLKCMSYDEPNEWVILYTKEASRIGLKISPKQVPKEMQPLVIATCYLEDKKTLLVDVRSIERAEAIIRFIDCKISRSIAEITHAAIYNRLITANPECPIDVSYDDIFNKQRIAVIDPGETVQEIEERSRKPLPEVEELPIHYYQEGILPFKTACQMRQMIAIEHFLGNKDVSFYDLAQKITSKNAKQQDIKEGWVYVGFD